MKRLLPVLAPAALTAALLAAVPAAAQEPARTPEEPAARSCIETNRIDQTTVIDDQTILVEVLGPDRYRQITLKHGCPGLRVAGGFSYRTTFSRLCRNDHIQPLEQGINPVCAIGEIVTLSEDQAKALRERS